MPSGEFEVRVPHPADVAVHRPAVDLSGATDFHIGRVIHRDGLAGYEPEVFAMICALVETSPEPVRFLDIGANIGLFSLLTKCVFGERLAVTAFEPLPVLAEFLRGRALENRLTVDVSPHALSDRDGTAEFYVSRQSDTSNSLNRRFRPHKDVIEVSLRRLDGLLPDGGGTTYVLKVDTESTEPDVLAGGAAFVDRARPVIVCEVLAGRTETRLAEFFSGRDYLALPITESPGWEGASEITGDATYRYRDWVFLPAPPTEALKRRFARWLEVFVSARP